MQRSPTLHNHGAAWIDGDDTSWFCQHELFRKFDIFSFSVSTEPFPDATDLTIMLCDEQQLFYMTGLVDRLTITNEHEDKDSTETDTFSPPWYMFEKEGGWGSYGGKFQDPVEDAPLLYIQFHPND